MLAMERAKTAREAIQIMGDLAVRTATATPARSFSGRPYEVWVFEIVGPGPWEVGDPEPERWVAARVPDGHIAFRPTRP